MAFATWLIRHCDHHLISRKSDLDVVTLSRALVYSHLINIEKTYNYPPPPQKETAAIFAKLCALDLFFRPRQWLTQISLHHWNILSMHNKHRKLFVVKQSKGANLCLNAPKYVRQPGSAWTRWGSLCAPQAPSRSGGLSKGSDGMELGLQVLRGGREGERSTFNGNRSGQGKSSWVE